MWVYRARSGDMPAIAGTALKSIHYEVGFYDPAGAWIASISCPTAAGAANWVHYLNGGDGTVSKLESPL